MATNSHPEDVKAALRKRYGSLIKAAAAQGVGYELLKKSLYLPRPGGNAAIAKALGTTPHDIWPEWFDAAGRRLYLKQSQDSRPGLANHRQKRRAA